MIALPVSKAGKDGFCPSLEGLVVALPGLADAKILPSFLTLLILCLGVDSVDLGVDIDFEELLALTAFSYSVHKF